MKKSLLVFVALTSNAMAGAYEDHVKTIKNQRPYEKKKIEQLDDLTTDMVKHYDQAVVLGTTSEYEATSKIEHFNSFLRASDTTCADIDLAKCIYELVCNDEISHNLDTRIMPCSKR